MIYTRLGGKRAGLLYPDSTHHWPWASPRRREENNLTGTVTPLWQRALLGRSGQV